MKAVEIKDRYKDVIEVALGGEDSVSVAIYEGDQECAVVLSRDDTFRLIGALVVAAGEA